MSNSQNYAAYAVAKTIRNENSDVLISNPEGGELWIK